MGKVLSFNFNKGEVKMYIGNILKERMECLGVSISTLAEDAFLDEDIVSNIINNKISLQEIDELDLEFISSSLYCDVDYFKCSESRNKDIIHASMNRGICDPKTNIVKGRLQRFVEDFIFLEDIIKEVKGGVQGWKK